MAEHDVDRVVHLLAHWPKEKKYGKLTWGRLTERLAMTGPTWTRQALFAKSEIADAFQRAKDEIRGDAPRKAARAEPGPVEALYEAQLASKQAEIERLEGVLRDYDELFIRHHHNARLRGISVAELSMPLPKSPHGSPAEVVKARKR